MKKRAALDHLFVPPEEMRVFVGRVLGPVRERAYEIFTKRGGVDGHDFDDWLQAESELLQPVTAELSDAGDAFVALAAVTSCQAEDLRVSVEPRSLTICGFGAGKGMETSSSAARFRTPGFQLSFKLPAEVNTSTASADLKSDILEVRLPKASTRKNA